MPKDPDREKLYFKNFKWTAPRYYDYPDGQDLPGKLSYTTKIGFYTGAFLGMTYAMRDVPRPVAAAKLYGKALSFVPPFILAPVAFTLATYTATNYRKKDDQLNYIIGGIAAGIIGTSVARLPHYTVPACIIFAAIGFAKKTAQMKGLILYPRVVKRVEPPYFQRTLNTSIMKEGERLWTSTPPQ